MFSCVVGDLTETEVIPVLTADTLFIAICATKPILRTAADIEARVPNFIRFFSFGLSATLFSASRSIIGLLSEV